MATVAALVLAACAGANHVLDPGFVSAAQYGERWPLTVEWGIVRCEPHGALLFRAPDGTEYIDTMMDANGYPSISAIWKDTGNPASPKLSLDPIIEVGEKLCHGR